MGFLAIVVTCASFCTARLYVGGINSKTKKSCYCLEEVYLDVPPAIENFTLKKKKSKEIYQDEY